MGLKQTWNNIKESLRLRKEISSIQKNSYDEEMKKQAVDMGKKQAQIDAEEREKLYRAKMKKKREQILNPKQQDSFNAFGFDKENKNEKPFDFIGRSYLG